MANTGYIINPKVIQVFTSGPSSGSLVNSLFTSSFNVSSSFTSSMLCDVEYNYKEFNTILCPVSGYCSVPTIISASVVDCINYDYNYNIIYNINGSLVDIDNSAIQYSLSSAFTGEIGTEFLINAFVINDITVDISEGLTNLPLNSSVPVYFRMYNLCSASNSFTSSIFTSTPC